MSYIIAVAVIYMGNSITNNKLILSYFSVSLLFSQNEKLNKKIIV